MLLGLGNASFGAPVELAQIGFDGKIVAFTDKGVTDLAVANTNGITVIYGTPPTIP